MFKNTRCGLLTLGILISFVPMAANASHANCRSSDRTIAGSATALPCDVSFTGAFPAFSCTGSFPQTGVYTIRNNSTVTIGIGTPTLIINDAKPSGDEEITATTCGSSLTPGASCTITVTLLNVGPFNRTLQIPINSRQVELTSPINTPTVGCNIPITPVSGSFPCVLGTTASFGVLAGSAITNTGSTVITGDLGIDPNGSSSVTGFPPGIVTGTSYFADATALQAQNDLTTLYTCLANLPCGTTITTDLAGLTYTTGSEDVTVLCSGSTINLTNGTLTLNGNGNPDSVFIFQAGSALNITNATITLTGGLTPANVFWQVTSSAVLTAPVIFEGTIVALTSISMSNPVTMTGRALARNGAVTFINDTVTVP